VSAVLARRLAHFARGAGEGLRELVARTDQEWAIGLYTGPSPAELEPLRRRPILTRHDVTDRDADFVADPFLIRTDDRWWMFFEVWSRSRRRGEIGVASSNDLVDWRYQGIALSEQFHLSYPLVFEWEGEYYLLPECSATSSVRLYRAAGFPWQWECVATLLTGGVWLDPTIFRYDDLWWLMVETDKDYGYDTLRLYYSEHLDRGWREHPASPVVRGDRQTARPAGRVVVADGRPVRFAQDCDGGYGLRVRAFEISLLTTEEYAERPLGLVLDGAELGWNRRGMHHLDPHQVPPAAGTGWVACVDGWK